MWYTQQYLKGELEEHIIDVKIGVPIHFTLTFGQSSCYYFQLVTV